MATTLRQMTSSPPTEPLSTDEVLGLLVDGEWTDRENKKLTRRLRDAKLPPGACVEDIAADPARGIDRAVARSLATCQWIAAKQNVIVLGPTGVGKSFVAGSLAQAACRKGFRALCIRATRLSEQLAIARAAGSYSQTLSRLAKVDVLVLDDFLLAPMKDAERRDLLEVLEDRYDRTSTIITSQLPTKNWHEALGEPTIADAICDRLVHNAHVLALRGGSMRKKKGMGGATTTTDSQS
jgi:DNA replication protein DnaC